MNYDPNNQQNNQQGYQQNYQSNYQDNQQNYQPGGYQQPIMQLSTNRSLLKFILLSIVTCGIYGIICLYNISKDINTIASRYDGKETMNYVLVWILSMFTLGIPTFIWYHKISARIGCELQRRNYDYKFDASTYWIYNFVLSLIPSFIGGMIAGVIAASDSSSAEVVSLVITYIFSILSVVGPYIYTYKLFKSMNLLSESYNVYG